jgi:photosynthetic reaction center cytochrome c subunit
MRQTANASFRTSYSPFLAAAFLALLCAAPASAQFPMDQIPDEFTNLELLPKDISKEQLVKVMQAFTKGLGVRCHYCHVGEEGAALSTFDFASDEKNHKKIARLMVQMVTDINERHLPKLEHIAHQHDGEKHEAPRVECITCHRGETKPKVVEETPLDAAPAGAGADAPSGPGGD